MVPTSSTPLQSWQEAGVLTQTVIVQYVINSPLLYRVPILQIPQVIVPSNKEDIGQPNSDHDQNLLSPVMEVFLLHY